MPLLYLDDRGTVLLIASNNGGPNNPAWYHNLVANPIVDVETRAGRRSMRAEPLIGAERHHRFERIKAVADRYEGYQSRTGRELPVVALREVSA